ncbi:MAG: outer membrane protein assembly factor BamB family protein [Thermogutta sp.]
MLTSGRIGWFLVCWLIVFFRSADVSVGDDQPQWGERFTRNMVSREKNLPFRFDPSTGENIKWAIELGTNTYSSPVIASGRVFIGVNNAKPRDPRHQGDRAILMCLDEKTGDLVWQLVVPRLGEEDPYLDWPRISMCSPPTVEGNRVYTVTNRFEVVCLDVAGQANGNDGPYTDEGRHMVPPGEPPLEVTARDADIIWLFDLPSQAGIYPHDGAHVSILLDGRFLYLNTGNGVDNTHRKIRAPDAPSLIVLDKETGRLVAQDKERIGPRIFHSTWSSPAMGTVDGQRLIFFCGGDGVVYAFRALPQDWQAAGVASLERVWKFDCDPSAPKENVHQYITNRQVSPSNIKSMPVFYKDRVYVTVGGDIWWGKREAWLKCIDARGKDDITATNELWSYPLKEHCCSTPSIVGDLVFVADCGGLLHCVDADTGRGYWSHDLRGETWASTLVADGKVYVGTRRGVFWVFAAAREKQLLAEINLRDSIASTPVAANGVLYVTTLTHLYALELKGDSASPSPAGMAH